MPYALRNKNYYNRPARYCDSDWVTEFPRPYNCFSTCYSQWIMKEEENEEPLGHKHDGWASSDDDGFEKCHCGYWHHYEDKCPYGDRARLYEKWREDEEEKEKK